MAWYTALKDGIASVYDGIGLALQGFADWLVAWFLQLVGYILNPESLGAVAIAILDAIFWVVGALLPQSVEGYVESFQAVLSGPAMAAAGRLAMWCVGHFVDPAAVAAMGFAFLVAYPCFVLMRSIIWGFHQFWGSE